MTINRYPNHWQNAVHLQIADLRQQFPHAHIYIYALLEGVFDESCYPLLKRSGQLSYAALYANTPSADDETLCVSPLLIEYADSGRATWDALLTKTDGQPALSLIASPESLGQLTARLVPWCIVNAADYTLGLSFADTRILPELWKVLSAAQLAQFCGPALLWQYITRTADWCTLPLPASTAPPAHEVALDEQQCAQLMTAAEADGVLFQLRASMPDLVNCFTPARAHGLVQHWLTCASHAQIEALPERLSLCEWGLTRPELERHPQMAAWLAMPSRPATAEALRAQWDRQ
jgi:hypothetical protein